LGAKFLDFFLGFCPWTPLTLDPARNYTASHILDPPWTRWTRK